MLIFEEMQIRKNYLAAISLLINVLIIGVLLFVKFRAEQKLEIVSGLMQRLGSSVIDYTVHVEDTLDIATSFRVTQKVPVVVQMRVKYDLNLKQDIPVDQKIVTPVSLDINQKIRLDTAFLFRDKIIVPVNEMIHVDEDIIIPLNREKQTGIRVPIITDIPLRQDITLDIRNPIPVQSEIPIQLNISQDLPVKIKMQIPVDLNIPIDIPVNSEAVISFPYTLPVSGQIPIRLDIPVKIPLAGTPLKEKADSIGLVLKDLLKLF